MAKHKCSHNDCEQELPEGSSVPPGWIVANVQEFGVKTIQNYYIYICPRHTLVTAEKQTSLFEEASST